MAKKVLLISGNFFPEQTGIGKYNGEMMLWLSENGYDCTVISTFPYYPHWKLQKPYKSSLWYKSEYYNSIKVYRCPHYVPKNPSGAKRMLLDFSFLLSSMLRVMLLLFKNKYDVVIVVSPPFVLGFVGCFVKFIRGSKFIYHIQDLQIEAARDLKMIESNAIIKMLFAAEKFILKRADIVSSISEGMIENIQLKIDKKIDLFPNWSDITKTYPLQNKDELKTQFGFLPIDKIILYSGAIGEKQGLEIILYAAKSLLENRHLKFIICGAGPYKEKLFDITQKENLTNVFFLPLQPIESFNRFLNMADLHLVIQKSDTGDLVMPSKLTNILAVGGLVLVVADINSHLFTLINNHEIGLTADVNDSVDFINKLSEVNNTTRTKYLRMNARNYAELHLDINIILENLIAVF